MKLGNILLGSALASASLAHPKSKWAERMAEIESEVQRRAARPVDGPDDSNELLGDLVKPGANTPIGKVYTYSQPYKLTYLCLIDHCKDTRWR
jgi:hypothetical protein